MCVLSTYAVIVFCPCLLLLDLNFVSFSFYSNPQTIYVPSRPIQYSVPEEGKEFDNSTSKCFVFDIHYHVSLFMFCLLDYLLPNWQLVGRRIVARFLFPGCSVLLRS